VSDQPTILTDEKGKIVTLSELMRGTVYEHACKRGVTHTIDTNSRSKLLRDPVAGIHYPKSKPHRGST